MPSDDGDGTAADAAAAAGCVTEAPVSDEM